MSKPVRAHVRSVKGRSAAVASEIGVSIEPTPKAANAGVPIKREEISRLAHSYWEARGDQDGSPEDDWFRAEAELRARRDNNA